MNRRPARFSVSGGEKRPRRKLFVPVVGILLTLAVVQAFRSRSKQPDPNFVAAETTVSRYELGREQENRNYRHQVYQTALSRLKKVSPRSISAEPAAELSARIEQDILASEKRRASVRRNRANATHDRRSRIDALAASRRAIEKSPPPTFPECEHEESGDHADD